MAWPRRGRRYQRWWNYPPQYPYTYPPPLQIPPQHYPYQPYAYPPPMYPPVAPIQSPEEELAALEEYRKELEEEKARRQVLDGSTMLKPVCCLGNFAS